LRVAALVASPPVVREKGHEIGATDDPDQPAFAQDGDAPDALAGQEMGDRFYVGVLGNRNHTPGHDVANRATVTADHIELAHQAGDNALLHHRHAGDVEIAQLVRETLDRGFGRGRDDIARHDVSGHRHAGVLLDTCPS
jgi:hypothetical protein